MQRPVRITFRNMNPSDPVEQRIRTNVAGLARRYGGIGECAVTVRTPRQKEGDGYLVTIDIAVSDGQIAVGRVRDERQAHEDVFVAIREAFATAARQLEDYARRHRQGFKRHETPTYARIDKLVAGAGHGFLELADGSELYFREDCVDADAFGRLDVGDCVRVVVTEDDGGPRASNISLVAKRRGARIAGR